MNCFIETKIESFDSHSAFDAMIIFTINGQTNSFQWPGIFQNQQGEIYESKEWINLKDSLQCTIKYKDQSVYTGSVYDLQPHGKGKWVYKNGQENSYEGQFEYGLRNGVGISQTKDGNQYYYYLKGKQKQSQDEFSEILQKKQKEQELEFQQYIKQKTQWNNTNIYEFKKMEEKNGTFEGILFKGNKFLGKFNYLNGNIYEGQFDNNLRQGFGILKSANGDMYKGEWNQDKKEGIGQQFWKSENEQRELYIGQYKNGKMHGKGLCQYKGQNLYMGEYNQSDIEGNGLFKFQNGDFYMGEWKKNCQNGFGITYFNKNCEWMLYEGSWINDQFNGEGKLIHRNGNSDSGMFKSGRFAK